MIGIGLALILVAIVVAGISIWQLRRDAVAETQSNLRQLAVVLAEQTARALQVADLTLVELGDDIRSEDIVGVGDLRAKYGSRAAFDEILRRTENLPQVAAYGIVAADGTAVVSTRIWPTPPVSIADRQHFLYFAASNAEGVYVSAPIRAILGGQDTIFLSRRLTASDGSFLGIVLASIRLTYFDEFLNSAGFNEGIGVTLARADGVVLRRFPAELMAGEERVGGPEWYRASAAGGGAYFAPATSNPTRGARHVHVSPVAGYGVFVNVSRLERAAMSRWQSQAVAIGMATVTFVLGIGWLAQALARQFSLVQTAHNHALDQAEMLRVNGARLSHQSMVLKTTLDHMGQGLIMVDAAGTVVVHNRRAIELLELPPSLMANSPQFAELAELQRRNAEFDAMPQPLRDAVDRTSVPDHEQVYERRRPNGVTLEIRSTPLPQGGMVRTYTDVTARTAAEAMLAQSAARFRAFLDAAPDPIIVVRKDATISFANTRADAVFCYPHATMGGMPIRALMPKGLCALPIGLAGMASDGTTNAEVPGPSEIVGIRKDGSMFPAEVTLSRVETNDEDVTIVLVRDITERKRLQSEVEIARAQVIASARLSALGTMAGGIAHEINNPLAVIHARATDLVDQIECDEMSPATVREGAQNIVDHSERIAKIIASLRRIARDGEGDPFSDVSVRAIVDYTLDVCGERFGRNGVLLSRPDIDAQLRISCREVQISQTIINLLQNALDAVMDVEGERWVRLDVSEAAQNVVISVCDNGSGVPAALREKIMEPFFTTKPPGSGTGLGLSLSNKIVREHGGTLELIERDGHTCFSFSLPKTQRRKA